MKFYNNFLSMYFQESLTSKENTAQLNKGRTEEDNTGEWRVLL